MARRKEQALWPRVRSFFSGLTGAVTATAALIVAVVGALTAVGVIGGGGSGKSSDRPVTVTAAETKSWAAQANDACARANDTISALPQPKKGMGAGEATDLVKSAATVGHRMLRDLSALTPPQGQEQQVKQFLTLGAAVNNNLDEFAADLTLGDIAGVQKRVATLQRVNTQFNKAAIALGATTCAEGSSVSDLSLPGG